MSWLASAHRAAFIIRCRAWGGAHSYALVYNAMLKMFAEHIKEAVQVHTSAR